MQELLYFYLQGCPFCKKADVWLDELFAENPAYGKIPLRRVEERREAAFAQTFDYFYVPTFFLDGKKLHEGVASKKKLQAVLDAALQAQG